MMKRLGMVVILVACGGAPRVPAPRSEAAAEKPAAEKPAEPPDPGSEGEVDEQYKILASEAIGPLHYGADDVEIRKHLGEPKKKDKAVLEAATSEYWSKWTWVGVTADMMAEQTAGPWQVRRIEVKAPSKLATKAGIHVGSSRKDVEARYAGQLDRKEPGAWIVGSSYGGLLFTFQGDAVASISIGAFAE